MWYCDRISDRYLADVMEVSSYPESRGNASRQRDEVRNPKGRIFAVYARLIIRRRVAIMVVYC
jgi:hypothetical protein